MTTPTPDHWNAEHYRDRHAFVYESSRDLVADWLRPQVGERVLDLGCGSGELSAQIAQTGATVTGVDASEAMIAAARGQHPAVNFDVQDAQTLPYRAEFDAVFSNAALHWMKPLDNVLSGVSLSLVPGGRLALEMGGGANVLAVREAVEQALSDLSLPALEHVWIFPSPAQLAALLEEAGFTVERLHLFKRPSLLVGEDGFRAWLHGFGASWLAPLSEPERAAVIARAEELARPKLHTAQGWVADYVRLRALAVK
ncbi:methyltransferase domain-containing protein [Deinococcus psychrotolerans]|uniref:Methyltransferase domain-containing protein n=1 Tax=Deinococcus psychrotolerans TaxID=2489213 RepID=A0A3G8YAH4_9DEIO|nr:methyltransferase domain-containing protein [Deinococcus psychrotolerans]AZI41903.1 methyltransferase domain-containing protein [Deinococcus psychrotolerans]